MDDKEKIRQMLDAAIAANAFLPIGEQNPKIKNIKKLLTNSKPNPERLFIAEGLWIFKKLIEFDTEIDSLYLCPESVYTFEALSVLERIIAKSKELYLISDKTFAKLSEKDKPDGLLCLAKLPVHDIKDFEHTSGSIILVMDGVEIPGNIGTMIRMADGAGVDAVFICNKKARLTHPKLINSSLGAVLNVPVYEFSVLSDCIKWFAKNKYTVYLADTRAENSYYDEQYPDKTAFVMGSERYGISREWYDSAYKMISIPMLGKCDSLNVGVAATVLAYDASMKIKIKRSGK